MDARELLKSWPGIAEMTPEAILAHPAWRLEADLEGTDAVLSQVADSDSTDEIFLDITLDDDHHLLGIADSSSFSDLHLLWSHRSELPAELVIALVEKEVGGLLQLIERRFRKELGICGLAAESPKTKTDNRRSFVVRSGEVEIRFTLDLPNDVELALGVIDNLDVNHESIRSLERPARAEYESIAITDKDRTELRAGDFLPLTTDADGNTSARRWVLSLPDDEVLHVCAQTVETFSFAQLADETLPAVPDPGPLTIFAHGKPFAAAEMSTLGDIPAVKITTID